MNMTEATATDAEHIITIDLDRINQELGSHINAYGDIAISVAKLNAILERGKVK